MHISILVANTDESEFAKARPRDPEKWQSVLHAARPDWQITAHWIKDGEFPQDIQGPDGWIITGSPASANDTDPWVERLMDLIRQLHAAQRPIFGACFGHQAVARALGGRVGKNPCESFIMGRVATTYTTHKPWMSGDQTALSLHAAHGEQVLELPPGAEVLSSNAETPVGTMAIGDHILTTQYHPEITTEFMTDVIEEYASLPNLALDRARASMADPIDSALMGEWIARFFEQQDRPTP